MRKVLFTVATAASALAFAAPASAQYYSGPQAPYGNAYGYHNNRAHAFLYRIDQFRNDIRQFDREGRLSNREAARLDRQLTQIRSEVLWASQNGLNSRENRVFDNRLDRLRAQMRAEMRDGNRYAGRNYNNGWVDRDRDGRNDRYEDDRGWDHD